MATNLLSIYTQYQLLNCVKQNHYYILSSFSWDVDFPVDRPTHSVPSPQVMSSEVASLSWSLHPELVVRPLSAEIQNHI